MIRKFLLHPVTLGIFTLIVVSVIALRSLLTNSFYTSHDGFTHTARIAAYYKALSDGQFPPRWAKDLNGKLGSPIFNYIYPIPYLLGSLAHFGGFSYQDSFRLITALGYLAMGVTCFFWLRNKFGNLSGLLGAIFYLWVPYRFLNIYVRAAYAENLAYLFIPLIFLSVEKIFENRYKWFYLLVFSIAGMLLTHNLVAAIFLPLSLLWAVWQFLIIKKIKALLTCFFGLIIGFFLSSFIYFPDLFERQYIKFDASIVYFRDHFVSISQLVKSPWGYGFDFPGTIRDEISFQLGLAQLMMLILLLIVIAIKLFINRKSLLRANFSNFVFFLMALLGSILLMIDYPFVRQLWEQLPVLKTVVDFPWRFLGVTNVAFAFLVSYFLSIVRFKKIVFILLLCSVLIANRNHLKINQSLSYSNQVFDNYDGVSTATSDEFTPIWRKSEKFDYDKPLVEASSGEIKVIHSNVTSQKVDLDISVISGGKIRVNRFYFPEIEILRNNVAIPKSDFEIEGATTEHVDYSGTILIKAVPGNWKYSINLKNTFIRNLGNIVSISLFFILIICFSLQKSVKRWFVLTHQKLR